ncbi:beta-ketoacyl-ACP synthase [Endozoicomonas sp.]|uniref:beta-ketoacyl-ACP synthase n=1 Tax=Endozoicomonas sp. TaxID=1892382 RepID=UPI002883BE0D|nr:beta-ketoacyl-ACP synthase [Endozoicomonas sp.]
MSRVVITGMSAITPLGNSWPEVYKALKAGSCGIRLMEDWQKIQGLSCYLAAPVTHDVGHSIPRKLSRSMSRVSLIAAQSAQQAIHQSQLNLDEIDKDNIGIAYGSSFGSAEQLIPFGRVLAENKVRGISPTGYIKLMGHTTAINLSIYLGIKGRLIPTSSACTSGSQALGYAYETIKHNIHPLMVAGSSEELSPAQVAVFDSFFAASRDNHLPHQSAKPFSKDRNGMVVGEGGATFILESLDHALNRKATILAEIVGFATNLDGSHIIQQNPEMMEKVIGSALTSANLKPDQIGYISAHATGTESDATEAGVINKIFSNKVPVSSNKGHMGHALGGSSSISSWLTINMMNEGWFAPTLNLTQPSDDCSGIWHIMGEGLQRECEYTMVNSFAFGGVNTSIIFKRWN